MMACLKTSWKCERSEESATLTFAVGAGTGSGAGVLASMSESVLRALGADAGLTPVAVMDDAWDDAGCGAEDMSAVLFFILDYKRLKN